MSVTKVVGTNILDLLLWRGNKYNRVREIVKRRKIEGGRRPVSI
jgi:hypothetical protein